jgi:hypothetical protein
MPAEADNRVYRINVCTFTSLPSSLLWLHSRSLSSKVKGQQNLRILARLYQGLQDAQRPARLKLAGKVCCQRYVDSLDVC